jgi:ribonuclease HI
MKKLPVTEFVNAVDKDAVVSVFTDGACSGNPGPGGWGVLAKQGDLCTEISGGEKETTNNRMELMAAIEAIEALVDCHNVLITTDSQYLKNGIESWILRWKKNGWKTADKSQVKTQDLWMRLDQLCAKTEVKWSWVKGHSGNSGNESVDTLAQQAIIQVITGVKGR